MKMISRLFVAFAAIMISFTVAKAQDTLYMKSGLKVASQVIEITPSLVRYKKADNPEGPTFVINATDVNTIKYRNGTIDTIKGVPVVAPVVKKSESIGDMSGTWSPNAPPAAPKIIDPHPPVYSSGMFWRYDNRRIKTREMHNILLGVNNSEIDMHIRKAKTAKGIEYIGFVAIPAFAFGVGYTLVALINNDFEFSGNSAYSMSYAPGIICGVVAAGTLATSITFKIVGRNHNQAAVRLYNEKY